MAVTISANGVTIYTINDDMIKALQYSMPKSAVQNALLSIVQSNLDAFINTAKNKFKDAWLPILIAESTPNSTIPVRDVAFANLIFARPDYLDYDGRNP